MVVALPSKNSVEDMPVFMATNKYVQEDASMIGELLIDIFCQCAGVYCH